MTLSLKEFNRLKGLMALTTSNSDAEALVAIQAANRLLGQHNLTWEKVFAKTVTVISEMSGQVVTTSTDEDLEAAFELALGSTEEGTSFYTTLTSIHEAYEKTGRLTQRQRQVVEDAAERAADRRPAGRFR